MAHFFKRRYHQATSAESVERFVTSWILPPPALLFWRALVAVYAFTVIFIVLAHESIVDGGTTAARSFSYFTVLGYWGIAWYHLFAAAHTLSYQIYGRSWLQDWPSSLQWAHSCFYSTVTTFPFVVTIVFWTLLGGNDPLGNTFSAFSNMSMHALNSLIAGVEIFLTRTNPHPWINLPIVIIILALYLALAELCHAINGYYVYDFLDPNWNGEGVKAAACVGILFGCTLIWLLSRYAIWLRKYVTESLLRKEGLFPRKKAIRASAATEEFHMQSAADESGMRDAKTFAS